MNVIRKALEARWFLLVITAGLVAMAGFMYSERSRLEWTPSSADSLRSLHAQQRIRVLLPGDVGEVIATEMNAADRSQLSYAKFVSSTRVVLSWMAFLGVVGCVINILPWVRRRAIGAVQPGVEPGGPSARGLTP